MHAFSGNDYVSSFFRKGKILFWKKIKSCPEYLNTFSELGNFNHTDLESFVCALYGYLRCKSVDKVRSLIFINKFKSENQAFDICNLPPCSKNLLFHINRSNYVSSIYKNASRIQIELEPPIEHGWDDQGNSILV